jgi:hypothetical protein
MGPLLQYQQERLTLFFRLLNSNILGTKPTPANLNTFLAVTGVSPHQTPEQSRFGRDQNQALVVLIIVPVSASAPSYLR